MIDILCSTIFYSTLQVFYSTLFQAAPGGAPYVIPKMEGFFRKELMTTGHRLFL